MTSQLSDKTTVSSRNKMIANSGSFPHSALLTSRIGSSVHDRSRLEALTKSRLIRPNTTFKTPSVVQANGDANRANQTCLLNHKDIPKSFTSKTPFSSTSSVAGSSTSSVRTGTNSKTTISNTSAFNRTLGSSRIASSTVRSSHNTTVNPAIHDNSKGSTKPAQPSANLVRKGLAKFSNPIQCQRLFDQFENQVEQLKKTLNEKQEEIVTIRRDKEQSVKVGLGYATVVQYLGAKLKLNTELDLEEECVMLKEKVNSLMDNEKRYEKHIKVQQDLRKELEQKLEETIAANRVHVENLNLNFENELDDLKNTYTKIINELQECKSQLESDLDSKSKQVAELRQDYEELTQNFQKLEDSLTKDKDARVKYAQEKIVQLQKDVESLNSVLEMKTERVRALEKDSLLLADAHSELLSCQEAKKTLAQQLETANIALERKRTMYEQLKSEHEELKQKLDREQSERRRMTKKTERLEHVLNETFTPEKPNVYNSSCREIDSTENIV